MISFVPLGSLAEPLRADDHLALTRFLQSVKSSATAGSSLRDPAESEYIVLYQFNGLYNSCRPEHSPCRISYCVITVTVLSYLGVFSFKKRLVFK